MIVFCCVLPASNKARDDDDALPLSKTFQLRLDNIRPYLVQLVDPHDDFITELYKYGCITWLQKELLKNMRESWHRNEKLVDFLRRRSIADYNTFAECLIRHNQGYVAPLLLPERGEHLRKI